jgi:hypothetical protein
MTTTPLPHRWAPLLLPPAEAIEWFITQLNDVTGKEHFTTCSSARDWFKETLIRANIAIDGVAEEQIDVWLFKALLAWDFYRRHRLRSKPASPRGGHRRSCWS